MKLGPAQKRKSRRLYLTQILDGLLNNMKWKDEINQGSTKLLTKENNLNTVFPKFVFVFFKRQPGQKFR